MKGKKKPTRKPALEKIVEARKQGTWTRSKTWGGKSYKRTEGKKVDL